MEKTRTLTTTYRESEKPKEVNKLAKPTTLVSSTPTPMSTAEIPQKQEKLANDEDNQPLEPVVRFVGVEKEYTVKGKKKIPALKGVSFLINPGEFVFLVGPSGSGKSTILRLIIKEESFSEGTIHIGGVDIAQLDKAKTPALRRQVGVVFQDFRLLNDRTVEENVAFALNVTGDEGNVDEKVHSVLGLVGLSDKKDRYPDELSGGEQQRVAIARAFVTNPPLLIADEPTGNLDPETSEDIISLLNLVNLGGTTVLMATHDSYIVNKMKKRVIRLDGGKVVQDKTESSYH